MGNLVSSSLYPNFRLYRTLNRTSLHSSISQRRPHFTGRGFLQEIGRWTIHVDDKGVCLDFYENAGAWTGKYFDIRKNCDQL
jgi:hypothetical protein